MSHKSIRKEKKCLNCGSFVEERYCPHCGQENVDPQETVWHFVTHFIGDILHLDGKFFLTLKKLFSKPGFLSEEYAKGRRANYFNPIKMYLFTSFIFFLILFSTNQIIEEDLSDGVTVSKLLSTNQMNPEQLNEFTATLNGGIPMDSAQFKKYKDSVLKLDSFTWDSNRFKSLAEYDSLTKIGKIKDNWVKKTRIRKQISITEKYGPYGQNKFLQDFLNSLLHSFPLMLFVSLPLVALLFKLFYSDQKKYFYVSHAVFTIHFYIAFFLIMLLGLGLDELEDYTNWNFLSKLQIVLFFGVWFYLYKAMRRFYKESRGGTILRFILFVILFFIILSILIVLFSLKSWIQV